MLLTCLAQSTRSVRLLWISTFLLVGNVSAWAQLGGSLSLQSDPRFRGVPLNNGNAQVLVSLSYDAAESGWYGGALATRMRFTSTIRSNLMQTYFGRVGSLSTGVDADVGVHWTHYASQPTYDYAEAYAGLIAAHWQARVYVSNNYFGRGRPSTYAELGLNWPLGSKLHGFAHVGALGGSTASRVNPQREIRFDGRIGATLRNENVEYQLTFVTVSRGGPYAGPIGRERQSWMVGATYRY